MASEPTTEELTEQMFAAVGRAITQWSFVEYELSKFFTLATGAGAVTTSFDDEPVFTIDKAANAAFYAIENWRTKLQVVDAAVLAYPHDTADIEAITSRWGKLSDKASKLARKRNRLAHWFVLPAQHTGTGERSEPISPARLCPPYGSPRYYAATGFVRKPELYLTVKQVRDLERAFCLLAAALRKFFNELVRDAELSDRDARLALDRLLSDERLDPPLQAALAQVRSMLD